MQLEPIARQDREAIQSIANQIIARWYDPSSAVLPSVEPNTSRCHQNLLQRLLSADHRLGRIEKRIVEQLVHEGWNLLTCWPRPWGATLFDEPRLIWGQRILDGRDHYRTVVSSVLPKHGLESANWQSYFETALLEIKQERATLLVSLDVAIGDRVDHAAKRLGIAAKWLYVDHETNSLEGWLVDSIHQAHIESRRAGRSIWISPPDPRLSAQLEREIPETPETQASIPIADRIVCLLPDRVYALAMRKKGRIQSILASRLSNANYDPGQVRVAMDSFLTGAPAEWDGEPGMVRWWLAPTSRTNQPQSAMSQDPPPFPDVPVENSPVQKCSVRDGARIWYLDEWLHRERSDPWCWLTHCTRSSDGPWPDESPEQYQDRLLMASQGSQPTPLATLVRILEMNRLIATSHLKRSEVPTVCFSIVPLDELLRRRTFRPHLHRWDWEPYGISIRRSSLEPLGAKACLYGDEDLYQSLTENERPFFQLDKGNKRKIESNAGSRMNPNQSPESRLQAWETEKEWRIVGDLRLSKIDPNDAIVFVPTVTLAEKIAKLSGFPVVVVEEIPKQNDVGPSHSIPPIA